MSAASGSEASRNFFTVLDEAERDESIVVTRGGDQVAVIAPVPRANGAAVRKVFRRHAVDDPADEDFVAAVASVREFARADLDSDSGPTGAGYLRPR
jgi:prevent-host-death family protein